MQETFKLKGKKYRIKDPINEAISIVRQTYPSATPHGSLGHWCYLLNWSKPNEETVAEAWPVRGSNDDWWLRVKEKTS
jgi:hypothetical protein